MHAYHDLPPVEDLMLTVYCRLNNVLSAQNYQRISKTMNVYKHTD